MLCHSELWCPWWSVSDMRACLLPRDAGREEKALTVDVRESVVQELLPCL